jgi:hypothetical protein
MSWYLRDVGDILRDGSINAPTIITGTLYGNVVAEGVRTDELTTLESAIIQSAGIGALAACTATIGTLTVGSTTGAIFGNVKGNLEGMLANVTSLVVGGVPITAIAGNLVANTAGTHFGNVVGTEANLQQVRLGGSTTIASSAGNVTTANVSVNTLYANTAYANVVASSVQTSTLSATDAQISGSLAVTGSLTVGSMTGAAGSITVPLVVGNLQGNVVGVSANVTTARASESVEIGGVRVTRVNEGIAAPRFTGNVTASAVTATNVVATTGRVETLEAGTFQADVLSASQINLPSTGAVLTGRIGMRADVVTGLVVDGNAFVVGNIHGDGRGITGFEAKTNESLEARLSQFASSSRRLYVSTSGTDTNLGTSRDQAFRTVKKAAARAVQGTVIWVEAGVYVEDNPIYVPPGVAVIGDSLRNTLLTALNPQLDYFHLTNLNYLSQLRFVDLRSPGFCAAFPCSLAQVEVTSEGRIQPPNLPFTSTAAQKARVPVIYSPQAPTGYYLEDQPPTTNAAANATVAGIISALLDGIADVVENEPGEPFPPDATSNPGGHTRAAALLRGNVPFFQAEMMAWISQNPVGNPIGPRLTDEQRALCERDVGYLVEAVASDLTTGRAVNSLRAAVAYYNGAASILPEDQISPTADAIRFLRDRAAAVGVETIVDPTRQQTVPQEVYGFSGTEASVPSASSIANAIVRVQALLQGFVEIVEGDLLVEFGAAAMSMENGPGCARIARVLRESRVLLQDDVMAWVDVEIPNLPEKARCRRDVGFILDALEFDLRNGAAVRTREYALKYYDGTDNVLPLAQITPTANAIRYLRDRIVARADAETNPRNVFDKNATTRYESLLRYKNLNGTVDAPDTSIQVDLPGPVMYVAYRLKKTNLKKWRVEARQTPSAPWEVIDARDDEVPSIIAASSTETATAVTRATGLIEGLASRVESLTDPFPPAAVENIGGHARAAAAVSANIAFLKAEIMAWVSVEVPNLDGDRKARCERDVGYIATAIAGDLRAGGISRTLEAAGLYYNGTRSILSAGTETPTANAIRRIGALLGPIIRNEPAPASLRLQTQVPQAFDDTGGDETTTTYPTSALTGYATYRVVLLQTQDSSTFKVGSVEFLDVQLPDAVSDGPALPNSVVADFEIVDPGAGYTAPPTITILKAGTPPTQPDEQAMATATLTPTGGSIASVSLQPRTLPTVQRLVLTNPGRGYVTAPTVTITARPGAEGSGAQARAWIDRRGRVVRLELVEGGSGYTDTPLVEISGTIAGPGVAATATASLTGTPALAWSMARGRGYGGAAQVVVSAPPPGGRQAVLQAILGDDYAELAVPLYDTMTQRNVDDLGRLVSVRLLHPGSGYIDDYGYADPPVISIPAPDGIRPIIVGSPYVQNCTNVSGPWDTLGEKVPVSWPLPWNPDNIYNVQNAPGYDPTKPSQEGKGRRIMDNSGAGGGIRIDGRCCNPFSPLRSFVVDAFTQVNQGGIGFLLTNLAYSQFVSTFGTFCNIHALSISGSFANFSNSVTDFGRRGLVARGYYREPYLVGQVQALPATWTDTQYDEFKYVPIVGYSSPLAELQFKSADLRGKGYTVNPLVSIAPPWGSGLQVSIQQRAEATVTAKDGSLTDLFLDPTVKGRGYRFPPVVTITPPPGYGTTNTSTLVQAEAVAVLTGVSKVRVTITGGTPLRFANNRKPDALSIVRVHGRFYTVNGAAAVEGMPNTYDVSFGGSDGAPPYIDVAHEVEFFQTSYISTGGHVFEYVGDDKRGCTYNSLPEYGGVPDATFEIVRTAPAKIFFTSSDHLGNQKIGDFFSVNQATGSVKLDAKNFDLSRISTLGPFIREGVAQGVTMREVSASTSLISSTGQPDGGTVPTQTAVKGYVDPRAVPGGGTVGSFLRWTGGTPSYEWKQFTVENFPVESRENLGIIRAAVRCDVISGLVADGDARIFGNLTADRVLVTDEITIGADLAVPGNVTAVTGNVSAGGNLVASQDVVSAGNVVVAGNVVAAKNVFVTGSVVGAELLLASGNVTAGNVTLSGNVIATNVIARANVFAGNVVTNTLVSSGGTITALGNLATAGNVTAGNVVTSTLRPPGGTLTALGNLATAGNVSAGNVITSTLVSSAGTLTALGNLATAGNVSAGNVITSTLASPGGTLTALGNLAASMDVIAAANVNAAALLVSGTATAGNLVALSNVTATNLICGGTITASGNVTATGNVTSLGMLVANAGLELTCAPSPHEPPQNRALTFDLVNDTTLNINARGTDGVVRTFTLSLDVYVPPGPVWITSTILPKAEQGVPYPLHYVEAFSPSDLAISYVALAGLPPGIDFIDDIGNNRGMFSGTSSVAVDTLYSIIIAAIDSNGTQTLRTFEMQYYAAPVGNPVAALNLGADSVANANYGAVVAISEDGTRVAVGLPSATVNSLARVGKVFVYRVVSGAWVLETTLIPPSGYLVANRNFGAAVSFNANGSHLAIGGPGIATPTIVRGCVCVFTRDASSAWVSFGTPYIGTTSSTTRWGASVRMDASGTNMIVSASDYTQVEFAMYNPFTNPATWKYVTRIGYAPYVPSTVSMTRQTWTTQVTATTVSSATTNTRLVIGLQSAAGPSLVRVISTNGGVLTVDSNTTLGTQFIDNTGNTSKYGSAVAIARETGDRMVVGAPGANTVYIYGRPPTSNIWTQERNISITGLGLSSTTYAGLGTSVSMNGNGSMIFAGAPSGSGGGAVFVFAKDLSGVWNLSAGPLVGSGIVGGDLLGNSISASGYGDVMVVGAPGAEISSAEGIANAGEAYVMANINGTSWTVPAAT